jgi:hypothetical protein
MLAANHTTYLNNYNSFFVFGLAFEASLAAAAGFFASFALVFCCFLKSALAFAADGLDFRGLLLSPSNLLALVAAIGAWSRTTYSLSQRRVMITDRQTDMIDRDRH